MKTDLFVVSKIYRGRKAILKNDVSWQIEFKGRIESFISYITFTLI